MTLPLNTPADPSDPHAVARYHMMQQQIRPWNVWDTEVLETMYTVRREEFVPASQAGKAFMDVMVPLTDAPEQAMRQGQCMLEPRLEIRMLQDLRVQPTDRVLEVGAGSGHMAALIAKRAASVVSLEIVPALADVARTNLENAGITNASVRVANAATDPIPEGPFDVIVLSGSVAEVPQQLLAQLRDGGRLGAFIGNDPIMRFTLVRRTGDRFETTTPWDANAPRLTGFGEPSTFAF